MPLPDGVGESRGRFRLGLEVSDSRTRLRLFFSALAFKFACLIVQAFELKQF